MTKSTFSIDGKTVELTPGETILQIAQANGIEIPTLCYSDKISKNTSCFVCVVKDLKTGRFLPSCSACPAEGAKIDASSEEVKDMRKTALNLLLSEHEGDCEAPCTVACPAHAAVEEYVRAGKNGDFLEALRIIKERIPLPISISRVCPRFCEKDCRKNIDSKPIAINDFKRLASDLHYDEYMEELPELTGRRVAIVGAGPAGLATAYFLRLMGIESIIFEKMPQAGGMLRYGIPEYRLPKKLLNKELDHFQKMGIKIKFGQELGVNLDVKHLRNNYDAVAITLGCWHASPMHCDGEEFAIQGIEWLAKIAQNNWSGVNPGTTLVIGGGNTAMDCVRTAIRLGSNDVHCLYRRTEKEMPAEDIEILEAKEEGVSFDFLLAPIQLKKESNKLILTCQKMKLGEPDASGRRRPVPVEDSDYDIVADTVIAAIGQKTEAFKELKADRWGNMDACSETSAIGNGVFATGDCVTGAATVVEAVGGARRMALSILDFLEGNVHVPEHVINVSRGHWRSLAKEDIVYLDSKISDAERVPIQLIELEERKSTFNEVTKTIQGDALAVEGERCIECSCTAKSDCMLKKHSEQYCASPETITGEKVHTGYDNRHPHIIHDRMKCIKCGICVKICNEVVNMNLLSQKHRGYHTTVETAFGRVLPDSCSECGNCIAECPVGALDWKNKNQTPVGSID